MNPEPAHDGENLNAQADVGGDSDGGNAINPINKKTLSKVSEELLVGRDLDKITFRDFVNELESALTLQPGGLDEWRMEIRTIVDKKVRKEMNRQLLESVKKKRKIAPDTCQIKAAQTSQVLLVYLITWTPSADEEVSREVVFERLRECLEASQVNRSAESRSSIEKCCVFKEPHKSGKPHYHAALKLTGSTRWKPWKEALASTYSMVVNFSTCDQGWLGRIDVPSPLKLTQRFLPVIGVTYIQEGCLFLSVCRQSERFTTVLRS